MYSINNMKYKVLIFSLLFSFFTEKGLAQNAQVTLKEDPKMSQLLSLKKEMEKDNKFADGYTIQLYYGEKNRANAIIRKYRNTYTAWSAAIKYETPNYKVWVGNYNSRLEANRALLEIKKTFSDAFMLPKRKSK